MLSQQKFINYKPQYLSVCKVFCWVILVFTYVVVHTTISSDFMPEAIMHVQGWPELVLVKGMVAVGERQCQL